MRPHDLSPAGPHEPQVAKLRPWLRRIQNQTAVFSFLVETFRLLIKGRRRWGTHLSRWGLYPRTIRKNAVWIHAFGPGEMRVAITLVLALPKNLPTLITSPSSGHLGREALGQRAEFVTAPAPFLFVWRRFLRRFSPRQLIIIEAIDLVPLLCLRLIREEIPTAVINGWVTRERLEVNPCYPLLDKVQILCVRGEEDRELLAGIGIPREKISLTGEMKFDAPTDSLPEIEARIQKLARERPILIAGSTHSSEEPTILDAFERLGGGDRALLILAPRGSFDLTETLLRSRGIRFVRRTRFPVSGRPAVVLLDKMGELASLYRLAAVAFVGDSLSPRGRGHNPIEPARFAVPIAVGPNTANFQLVASLFDRANAWLRVADANELARAWATWLDNPELARQTGRRAADLVESQRGLATAMTLERLRPFLGIETSTQEAVE